MRKTEVCVIGKLSTDQRLVVVTEIAAIAARRPLRVALTSDPQSLSLAIHTSQKAPAHLALVLHTSNSSTWETEVGRCL